MQLVCSCFSFIGIMLITKPQFLVDFCTKLVGGQAEQAAAPAGASIDYELRIIGSLLCLLGAIFRSGTQIIFSYLKNKSGALVLNSYFIGFSMVLSSVYQLYSLDDRNFTRHEFYMLFFVGFFGVCANILETRSFQLEKANIISIVAYIEIILGFAYDIFLFNNELSFLSILGSIIIFVFVTILIVFRDSGPRTSRKSSRSIGY